jgi:hypothetical protein
MTRTATPAILLLTLFSLMSAANAAAQPADIVTVASVNTCPGTGTVDVPVYIRDTSGTSLGIDQPPGSRIQSYSIKVNYSPAAAVQSITFTRAGITAGLTPTLELTPSSPGSVSLLDTFPEATQLIPFTSNAAVPGNLVGHLTVTLTPAAAAAAGTIVALTVDPTLTQLTDEGGSGTTKESTLNANLVLVNGLVSVVDSPDCPTLSGWALALLAAALVAVAFSIMR